jgi:UDP-glucose 4-epimerase
MSHVIVTGGAGFIGSHLVERLLTMPGRVSVIDDLSTGQTANLSAVAGDSRLTLISRKISECPDLNGLIQTATSIFHLAATVGVEYVLQHTSASLQNNLRESDILIAAAARHRVPLLLASSSEVYGKSESFSEDDELVIGPPTVSRWSYACSKLMVEFLALAAARESGLPVIIARLFNTVGPRQTGRYGMVLPRFMKAALAGQPLRVFGDGRQSRCFCWVGDTVEALLRLQQTPDAWGGIVNVGSTNPISILDLAKLVKTRLNSPSEIQLVPYDQAYGPGFEDLRHRCPDVSKLSRLTGFKPSTTLEEIIDRTRMAAGPPE